MTATEVDAMRLTRIASMITLVGFLLILGAVAAIAAFGERLLATAVERAGPALLGREVRVGTVAIDWGRHATIRATDLALADAVWSTDPAMLRIRRTEVSLDLVDLLRLRLSPVSLVLQQPALHLARSIEGQWNLPRGVGASGGIMDLRLAALRWMEIEGGEITVSNRASAGVEARITALSASLVPAAKRVEFSGMASHDGGAPFPFSGQAGSPAALLDDAGGPFPVRLAVGPEAARLSAEGHVVRPFDLAGVDLQIRAQGEDLAPLLVAFGVGATGTPPFDVTARLTDTARGWSLKDLAARMGESELRGEAAVSAGGQGKPQLSMDLVAPQLVPSDLGWLASLDQGRERGSGSIADTRLPTVWLHRMNARGKLRLEHLSGLAGGPAALRLDFELEEGRLHVEPLRFELAGGMAEGSATLDAGGGGPPRLALRADADDLQLGRLMAMFGIGELTGRLATASVDLRSQGMMLREVAEALDGELRFRVAEGSIGLPSLSHMSMGLVEALGVAMGGHGGGSTPLTCAIGNVPVRGGVAHVERLLLVIPNIVIVGEGTVRLGDATLNLTLTPRPRDEALLRVVVPVVVSGDLTSPQVSKNPDLRVGSRSAVVSDPCGHEADGR